MNGFATGLLTGLLSLGAVAISPSQDVLWGPTPRTAPEEDKLEQTFHLDVFLRDAMGRPDNPQSREVQLVRDCLTPVLTRFAEPEECADAVRATLTRTFASRVVVEELDQTYKAVWDPENQVMRIICCDSLAIEVDVDGTIVSVPVAVGTFLD